MILERMDSPFGAAVIGCCCFKFLSHNVDKFARNHDDPLGGATFKVLENRLMRDGCLLDLLFACLAFDFDTTTQLAVHL